MGSCRLLVFVVLIAFDVCSAVVVVFGFVVVRGIVVWVLCRDCKCCRC